MTREQQLEAALRHARQNMPHPDQMIDDALAAPATVASPILILSEIAAALPRWIIAMGDWGQGGEQAMAEMNATLDDIRSLAAPATAREVDGWSTEQIADHLEMSARVSNANYETCAVMDAAAQRLRESEAALRADVGELKKELHTSKLIIEQLAEIIFFGNKYTERT